MLVKKRAASIAVRTISSSLLPNSYIIAPKCNYSTEREPDLKATLEMAIPAKRARLKRAKSESDLSTGYQIGVSQVIGGMRGLRALLWEGSTLDPEKGICFQGHTINSCRSVLPKGPSGTEMLPEAMFWLLLTGQSPSTSQIRGLSRQLANESNLPEYLEEIMYRFPKDMHPMTQFACAVSALSHTSKFAKAYQENDGNKFHDWESAFDDSISLLAKLPTIAGKIYQALYQGDDHSRFGKVDVEQDWSYNFATLLGRGGEQNENFQDLLRLYLALHSDHEGGNVSAHTTHLVGSALSDPFLSYSAGLQGLAGPLHGLAAQNALRWILKMQSELGSSYNDEDIKGFVRSTLSHGKVVPGFGHAILRKPDPRFQALMDFASSRPEIAEDPLYQLVERNSRIAPEVLKEHGKPKNPYPNVDAISGMLFYHYGIRDTQFYTMIFGVSRGLGPLAQLIWDRVLSLPIERPKSMTLADVLRQAGARYRSESQSRAKRQLKVTMSPPGPTETLKPDPSTPVEKEMGME